MEEVYSTWKTGGFKSPLLPSGPDTSRSNIRVEQLEILWISWTVFLFQWSPINFVMPGHKGLVSWHPFVFAIRVFGFVCFDLVEKGGWLEFGCGIFQAFVPPCFRDWKILLNSLVPSFWTSQLLQVFGKRVKLTQFSQPRELLTQILITRFGLSKSVYPAQWEGPQLGGNHQFLTH